LDGNLIWNCMIDGSSWIRESGDGQPITTDAECPRAEGNIIVRIKLRPGANGMVVVCIGDVIRFEVHSSHVQHGDSLRVIIEGEIDSYRRWGRIEDWPHA
jgi:hypothetical protein